MLLTRGNDRAGVLGMTAGDAKERDLSWLDWSVPNSLSADGKVLLFTEAGEGGGPKYAVYVRNTDGSPAIRLGEGSGFALSPDGKWAASHPNIVPSPIIVLPTGVGETRAVAPDGLNHVRLQWLANGKQFVFSGNEPGKGLRLYVESSDGGKASQLVQRELMIPFQLHLIASLQPQLAPMGNSMFIRTLAGGEPRLVTSAEPGEAATGWTADSNSLFVFHFGEIPERVTQITLATGQKKAVERPRASGLCGTHKSARPPHGRRRQELRLRVCQNAVGSISRGRIAIAAESSGSCFMSRRSPVR